MDNCIKELYYLTITRSMEQRNRGKVKTSHSKTNSYVKWQCLFTSLWVVINVSQRRMWLSDIFSSFQLFSFMYLNDVRHWVPMQSFNDYAATHMCYACCPSSQARTVSGGHRSRPMDNCRLPLIWEIYSGYLPCAPDGPLCPARIASWRDWSTEGGSKHIITRQIGGRPKTQMITIKSDRSVSLCEPLYDALSRLMTHPWPDKSLRGRQQLPLDTIASAEAQHEYDAVNEIGGCILSKAPQRNLWFHLTDCAAEISFSCYLREYRENRIVGIVMLPNSAAQAS